MVWVKPLCHDQISVWKVVLFNLLFDDRGWKAISVPSIDEALPESGAIHFQAKCHVKKGLQPVPGPSPQQQVVANCVTTAFSYNAARVAATLTGRLPVFGHLTADVSRVGGVREPTSSRRTNGQVRVPAPLVFTQ